MLSSLTSFSSIANRAPTKTNTTVACAYSMRIIVPGYTGPVVRLRRSTDNALQDFYSNSTQSYLTTEIGGTGLPFSSWLAGTVYVKTWYDQSGNDNHASNNVNGSTQPTLALQDGMYVVRWQSALSTILNMTSPFKASAVFTIFYNTNSSYGTILSSPALVSVKFGSGLVLNGDSNSGDWFYSGSGEKVSYVNGTSASSLTALSVWQTLSLSVGTPPDISFTTIGSDIIPTRSINGYMADMVLYNTPRTTTEASSYFYDSPQNSWRSIQNMCFAYSLRRVVPEYTGPVIRVRRSNDNTQQDFYSDYKQTYLTTAAGGTGTSYASWVGSNTGYVIKWYDQSGTGNHAINTSNNTTQPKILNGWGKYLIKWTKADSTVLNITSPCRPNTVFFHCMWTNTTTNGNGTVLAAAGIIESNVRFGYFFNNATLGSVNGDSNSADWFYSGVGTKLSYVNGQFKTTVQAGQFQRVAMSVETPVIQSDFAKVGCDGYDPVNRSIDGYMSELICHNKPMIGASMAFWYKDSLSSIGQS